MKSLFFLLLIFPAQNALAQCTLSIRQVGKQTDTLLVANIEDTTLARIFKRINDSTLEYTDSPVVPDCIFLMIDRKSRWFTRVWIDATIRQKVLVINYMERTAHIKNGNEWDVLTEKLLLLNNDEGQKKSDSLSEIYVNKYPDSYFSLWLLSHGMYRNEPSKKMAALNSLSPALREYPEYRQTRADLLDRKYPVVGDPFKEFSLVDVNDSVFNTHTIKNKCILLDFWSNSCAPCVRGMDALVDLYNSIDTSKVVFISVALDEIRNSWKSSPATRKIKWTNVWQSANFYGELCLNYNVNAMPFYILFDKEKKIYLTTFGDELELIKSTLLAIE